MIRPTAPGLTCPKCSGDLYAGQCRRSEDGWRHTNERTCYEAERARQVAARIEDVRFMVETGENLHGAAKRLGMLPDSLDAWMRRNGLRDELQVLIARNPAAVEKKPVRYAA